MNNIIYTNELGEEFIEDLARVNKIFYYSKITKFLMLEKIILFLSDKLNLDSLKASHTYTACSLTKEGAYLLLKYDLKVKNYVPREDLY